jgi:hypothetical protein
MPWCNNGAAIMRNGDTAICLSCGKPCCGAHHVRMTAINGDDGFWSSYAQYNNFCWQCKHKEYTLLHKSWELEADKRYKIAKQEKKDKENLVNEPSNKRQRTV